MAVHRKYSGRLVGLTLALVATLACGSDSGPSTQPAVPEYGAGGTTAPAGAGGSPATGNPVTGTTPPAGTVAPGESTNAGLGNVPVVGAGAGETAGGGAAGVALSDAGSLGGSASVGGASAGTASVGGSAATGAAGTGSTQPQPGTSPFPSGVTRPKIMIVGDSISAGPGCYKKFLLADLNANGYSNFDFVGEYTDTCAGGTVRHSAVSCSTATQYTQPTFVIKASCGGATYPGLPTLAAKYDPDMVMIQLGVNDVWDAQSTDAILGNYTTLVEEARAQNPNVVIAVAQIQQISPDVDGPAVLSRAQALVNAVPAWARSQSQPQSPVFVADLWTNSHTAETKDGVHPTDDVGSQRMGQNWFDALKNILPAD
jgi:lysophospholipase L1-like esterase